MGIVPGKGSSGLDLVKYDHPRRGMTRDPSFDAYRHFVPRVLLVLPESWVIVAHFEVEAGILAIED